MVIEPAVVVAWSCCLSVDDSGDVAALSAIEEKSLNGVRQVFVVAENAAAERALILQASSSLAWAPSGLARSRRETPTCWLKPPR